MLVLSPFFYEPWCSCQNPVVRFWVRYWEDGLYTATHPYWSFNPLHMSALAEIWPLFNHRYGRPQRDAIKTLAFNRANMPDGQMFSVPPIDSPDATWTAFFSNVQHRRKELRSQLFLRLTPLFQTPDEIDHTTLMDLTSTLAAELMVEGVSDRELFLRTAGVIGRCGGSAEEDANNVVGLLNHLERAPRHEFVVMTEIVGRRPAVPIPKRLANRHVDVPAEIEPALAFVRFEGRIYAASRIDSTHSTTAIIDHRFAAWQQLQLRGAISRANFLELDRVSTCFDPTNLRGGPWRHSIDRKSLVNYLPLPDHTIEADNYLEARDFVEEDSPHSIAKLKEAFERQLGKSWWGTAATRYERTLGRFLRRDILAGFNEYRDRHEPPWLIHVPPQGRCNLRQVADAIDASGSHADPLLASRLRHLSRSQNLQTKTSIEAMMAVAQGIRNMEEHGVGWPHHLRAVSNYLGKLLLYVFAACFPAKEATPPNI